MDTILKNMRTDRTLWGSNKYRILSYGEPNTVAEYRDAMGRLWITAKWIIGFSDQVIIMYILPLPDGPGVITLSPTTQYLDMYEWDLRKVCDHTHALYEASFDDWNSFMMLEKYLPSLFNTFTFSWKPATHQVSFKNGEMSWSGDEEIFDWSGDSELAFTPAYYQLNGKIEFGIRKIIINRDVRRNDFAILYKNIQPDSRLGAGASENWDDIVTEKFPFDGTPTISTKDNTGSMGVILPSAKPQSDMRFSIYLVMTNPQSEENLMRRFSALKKSWQITQ
jgi:hypothetical protein